MANGLHSAEDAFVSFVTTGKLSFSSLATSILADLARIEARKAISSIASYALDAFGFGMSNSAVEASRAAEMARITAQASTEGLAGHRATGGSVLGGSAYLVGERGPEIFKPAGAGTIIPNHQIGGAGGGIQINTNITVSDSGTSSSTEGSSGTGRALADMISTKVKEVIVREKRQGGLLWQR
jgi:phage-related minor tail protein